MFIINFNKGEVNYVNVNTKGKGTKNIVC
jgi:hypothetical protein